MDSGEKSYIIVLCKIDYVVGLQTNMQRSESKEEDLLWGGLFFYCRFEIVLQTTNCWENSDKCFCFLIETRNQNIGSESSYF